MIATLSEKEDKLIIASRLLDEKQLDMLVDIINYLVINRETKSQDSCARDYIETLESIRNKAKERGLTPEILEKMLLEDE